jgi:hypothetical protein
MTEFIENTFKAKKEFENWSIDLAGLARYLNEDDAVIELAGKYTLSLNLIDMVEKSTWTYSLDSNVSDYLAEHDEEFPRKCMSSLLVRLSLMKSGKRLLVQQVQMRLSRTFLSICVILRQIYLMRSE